MESSYISGRVFIDLSEQTNSSAIIADGIIDEREILSMNLMYEGAETTVRKFLASNPGETVNLSVFYNETEETANLKLGNISSATKVKAELTTGLTQEDICAQILDSMIWDELQIQLREIASQGMGDFSYDKKNM